MATSVTLAPDGSRPAPIGAALAAVPESVYEAIDRGEPEWSVLERLAGADQAGLLTALALALSDYQLGTGGAARYWEEVNTLLEPSAPKTADDVRLLMGQLMARPVASRLKDLKLARIDRLLGSGVPALLRSHTLPELGRQPLTLWHELANGMRQALHDKTIAFAMKVFDLIHRIATGRYVTFPADVPIVADLRVARVSLSSGLLRPTGVGVPDAMAQVAGKGGFDAALVRTVWAAVATHAPGISLFRVDSLTWQIAEPIYRERRDQERAARAVVDALRRYGADVGVSTHVSAELTQALVLGP